MVVTSERARTLAVTPARQASSAGNASANPFRAQPAAYSPIAAGHLLDALTYTLTASDAHDRAALMLRRSFDASDVRLYESGTAALQAAIAHAASIVGSRWPVALPAFTCFQVATAAVGAGSPIVLYDVDPVTLAPDRDSLVRALRTGAKIVVLSPLFGVPFDLEAVEDLAAGHGAIAIEDAAQGHGASWCGKPLGAHCQIATVSFGRGKGWTGSGGGALLFRQTPDGHSAHRSAALPGVAREMRVVAAGAAQWALGRPGIYGLPASLPWLGLGTTRYHEPTTPRGMTRASARLLVRTAAGAALEAEGRRASAAQWEQDLPDADAIRRIHPPAGGVAGYLRYPVRLARGLGGFGPSTQDARRAGIAPTYPATLAELPAVRSRLHGHRAKYPGAATLVRELVTLPTHSLITDTVRERILQLLADYPAQSMVR